MPWRSTRSPRWRESPPVRAAACLTRLRRLAFVRVVVVFFVWAVVWEADPSPAPPDPPPEADAGAAQARAATNTVAAHAAEARSSCVARRGLGYDNGNPFSFVACGVSCRARAERDRATPEFRRLAPRAWRPHLGSPLPGASALRDSALGVFRCGRLPDLQDRCHARGYVDAPVSSADRPSGLSRALASLRCDGRRLHPPAGGRAACPRGDRARR